MTAPSPDTIEREREKLFVTDAELIRRMGVPEQLGRALIREFDSKTTGFPRKLKQFGDRRYWPAIEAYFNRVCGVESQGAARVAPERPVRTGLPRFTPAEPMRRGSSHD